MFDLTRRHWLGLVSATAMAGSAALAATPRRATVTPLAEGKRDYSAALDALARFAEADVDAWGVPGMTIAVIAADGFAATISVGFAEVAPEVLVTPAQLFQIGSISKSLLAFAALRLAGEGRLDLDANVAALVPDLPMPAAPITVTQLLDHTGGLPHDAPVFPRVPDGRLWTGFTPGAQFSYSNIGYDLLGAVIAKAAGRPYPAVLAGTVLRPLGMTHAEPVIRTADRARYAVGYTAFSDRPFIPRARLAPGPWLDIDIPAGSVAATPGDMVRYMRFVAQVGRGKGLPLFPDKLAARYAAPGVPAPDFGEGARYVAGLAQIKVGEVPCLHHTGGMVLFSSAVTVDPASGAGCFASTNIGLAGYRPRQVAAYGAMLLRAVSLNQPLPPAPALKLVPPVENAGAFAGRYLSDRGEPIEVVAGGATLTLRSGGSDGRLRPLRPGVFATDHPQLYTHEIAFAEPASGAAGLWWGGRRYGRGAAMETPPVASAIAGRAGLYLSNDPWVGGDSVVARGGTLVLEGGGELVDAGDYWTIRGEGPPVDRLRFEAPLGGRFQRLNFSGVDLLRFAEPVTGPG